jgi:alcohol dehydrogenase class IV
VKAETDIIRNTVRAITAIIKETGMPLIIKTEGDRKKEINELAVKSLTSNSTKNNSRPADHNSIKKIIENVIK